MFPIDEEMDSHPNCRCSQEPVEDITDENAGFDPTALFNELTDDEQAAVLGRAAQEQYAQGDLTLRQVASERGGKITIRQLDRDAVRREIAPQHLEGYKDLPGAAAKLPPSVQDAITDQATASGRALDWLDHVSNDRYGDPYFRTLATGMGVDTSPRLVADSKLDFFKSVGEVEIFRGVGDERFAREFIEGASNPGRGVYGSGYYSSNVRATADSYAGDAGAVVRMTISNDARVVDWDEMVSVVEPSALEYVGFSSSVRTAREASDIAPLPFEPSPALNALLKGRSSVGDFREAGLRSAEAAAALREAWEEAVGPELWSRLYDPSKRLEDQPILLNVANKSFTVPGVKIPQSLRDAANDFVTAQAKYKRAKEAAEEAVTDFSSAVKIEGDAMPVGSTPALLSGYDVIRVAHSPSEQFYIILNRDVIRVSDTIEVKRNGEWVKERVGKNEEEKLAEHIKELVDERVTRAEALRDRLDDEMQDIARRLGAKLDGLAFSVKGRESMERKVRTKVLESRDAGNARSAEDIIAEDIRDANRYTMIVNTETYGDDVARFVEALRARGYRFDDGLWRNTWSVKDEDGFPRAYRGLNVNMRSPDGDLIEVQFHTPESFKVKQKNHKMYEEARLPETSATRRAELEGQMAGNVSAIPEPKGWESVVRVPGGSFAEGTVTPSEIAEVFAGTRGVKKDVAEAANQVLAALDEFMQLPISRNIGGKIKISWGGPQFTKKELEGTAAYYERRSRGGEFYDSEIAISGTAVNKTLPRPEQVRDAASTFAHEFGHMIEGELFGSKAVLRNANLEDVGNELYDWFQAVSRSRMVRHWREKGIDTLTGLGVNKVAARGYYDYYMMPEELWARSFAQWFARKTGGKVYTEEGLRSGSSFDVLVRNGLDPHWAPDDFDEIEEAFDKLFREKGWML